MPRDKSKKEKKEKKSKEASAPASTPVKSEEEKTSGFDFGGLPARDLKKNLGCG